VRSGGSEGRRTFLIAVLEEAGEALREYFTDVQTRFKQSEGITTLTPDAAIADEVEIFFGAKSESQRHQGKSTA